MFGEDNLQRLPSKQEEMKLLQRMVIMRDLIKKSRYKGSMDAKNSLWVSELLAKDCEKAWTYTGWEDAMQKWYEWLDHVKMKDERKNGGDASAKGGEDD